jgi:hypothetical protein
VQLLAALGAAAFACVDPVDRHRHKLACRAAKMVKRILSTNVLNPA